MRRRSKYYKANAIVYLMIIINDVIVILMWRCTELLSGDDFVFIVEICWWMNILHDELIKGVWLVVFISGCYIAYIDALWIIFVDGSFKWGELRYGLCSRWECKLVIIVLLHQLSVMHHCVIVVKRGELQIYKGGLVTCPEPRIVVWHIYKGGPGSYEEPNVELLTYAYELVSLS